MIRASGLLLRLVGVPDTHIVFRGKSWHVFSMHLTTDQRSRNIGELDGVELEAV
jgi:hypothetical protein